MWGFIVGIAEWIWGAVQTAYDAIVIALQWSVKFLWTFATAIYNGLIDAGKLIARGFDAAWRFTDHFFTQILPQAWSKFWTLFDRFRTWLTGVFKPVLDFLHTVRDEILGFYKTWIRPVLDIIDATRGILRVLELLHIKIAATIDAWLGQLESYIEQPFKVLLSKLNEVVDFVNRIETADGLIQRVAHIRTLQRDILYSWRVLTNSRVRALTDEEKYRIERSKQTHPIPVVSAGLVKHFETGDADVSPLIAKSADVWAGLFSDTSSPPRA